MNNIKKKLVNVIINWIESINEYSNRKIENYFMQLINERWLNKLIKLMNLNNE